MKLHEILHFFVEVQEHIQVRESGKVKLAVREAQVRLLLDGTQNLFNLRREIHLVIVVRFELLDSARDHGRIKLIIVCFFISDGWVHDDFLELGRQVLLAHLVVLGNLRLYLLLVTVVEDGEHEIQQHVQAKHQEDDKVNYSPIVNLPVREYDVREVRRGKQHVHVEHGVGHRYEKSIAILVYVIVE